MTLSQLQDYTFSTKYARWAPELGRRETYAEAVNRVFDMHARRYAGKGIDADIQFAREAGLDRLVLGSQRALQFGGKPVEAKHARLYNCCVSYCDRPRFFQEALWLLLCGCGVGFSVQRHHIAKLPMIAKPTGRVVTFKIPDSIEGWADGLGVLLSSYFVADAMSYFDANTAFPEYAGCQVKLDYSLIRPEGAPISSGSGKAPGPEPLRRAMEKIQLLLDVLLADKGSPVHLRTIDAYDIMMHASDAVLAGGVRRSATICVFSVDDQDMITAKTGNWFDTNPQRGRSNNSALLLRAETSFEQFNSLMTSVKEFGEPGFVWADNTEILYNPCQPASAPVITPDGLRCFADIQAGDRIWSKEGWTTVLKKWKTGTKPVYRYDTSAGFFLGTENHRVVSGGVKVEVGQASSIEVLRGPRPQAAPAINPQDVIDGLVLGDGTVHEDNALLCVGKDDASYHESEVAGYIGEPYSAAYTYKVATGVSVEELPLTYLRRIPVRYTKSVSQVCGVLRGLFSANGSCHSQRVTLKASSHGMVQDAQLLLSSVGIKSYITTNKSKAVEFSNGTYVCRQSYDLNITNDIALFERLIGFIQPYKQDRLRVAVLSRTDAGHRSNDRRPDHKILTKTFVAEEDVFDITVDNQSHTYWTGGSNVSNCVEIGMYPVDENDASGWAFCNLCEINVKACPTVETFERACKAAAILGTLQAGYTDFPYLGATTERIVRREALLGCSMTGMMDNPAISFNPEIQRSMAEFILEVNERVARAIGINPSARATCVKPAGTTSCILGTASGIHPHHAKRYFRRVQANQLEVPYQYFRAHNPRAVEASVWSPNKGAVITFCVEVPAEARTMNEVSALQLLELVKSTQENWVNSGKVESRCAQPWLRHNVSNTVTVRDGEWDDVARFIYDNREAFAGISLLSMGGELDYPQAPFCSVWTYQEIMNEYGVGALMASGLIVDGLHAFNGDLWAACSCTLGTGQSLDLPAYSAGSDLEALRATIKTLLAKKDWVRRANKFAANYFAGDVRRMTYCLKRVHHCKLWQDLQREYVPVDYKLMPETTDTTTVRDTIACSGGKCEL